MQKQRVVVTGMGIISPVGNDVSSFWDAITNGSSGAGPITLFDPAEFVTKFACEVKNFSIGDLIDSERSAQFSTVHAVRHLGGASSVDRCRIGW